MPVGCCAGPLGLLGGALSLFSLGGWLVLPLFHFLSLMLVGGVPPPTHTHSSLVTNTKSGCEQARGWAWLALVNQYLVSCAVRDPSQSRFFFALIGVLRKNETVV